MKYERAARSAGTLQGILLLLPITMAVMGIVVLAPIMPSMAAHFAAQPGVQVLTPLALTIPALAIGLLSGPAGLLVDRVGRRRTLVFGLIAYALVGAAPVFIDSLVGIIFARALLGSIEALIIVASTTLIGDYFEGREREKWLSAQLALASASAVVLFALGGYLGSFGWRMPFLLYGVSFIYAALLAIWTWEPAKRHHDAPVAASGARFPWKQVSALAIIAVFGAIIVFALQVQLPVLLTERYQVASPAMIGLFTAAGSIAVPVGTFAYRAIAEWKPPLVLSIACGLMGLTYVAMSKAPGTSSLLGMFLLNQLGAGILAPALVVWAMSPLSFEFRGRGTGLFMSGWWIGQFLSPQVLVVLRSYSHDLGLAIGQLGLCTLLLGVAFAAIAVWPIGRRNAAHEG